MKAKITLMSFGFKYGLPNANYYFDVGFIKNPAREAKWNFFSMPTDEMKEYILRQACVKEFIEKVVPLVLFLSKIDQHQVLAFGCNAGRHRSTVLVEALSDHLIEKGLTVEIKHRDME